QNPQPKGGNIIKSDWLKYYVEGEQPSDFERIVQSWDTANKTGETNDYSVCTTWGIKENCAYLLHVLRRKLEYPALKRTIVEHSKHHNAKVILIEDKASGTQLIQDLKADQLYGLKGIQRPAGCDKAMRLEAASLPFENGAIFLPKEAPWLKDYVAELTGFPGTKHDDQVDSTSQFIEWFKEHGREPGIITFYRMQVEEMRQNGLV
ncbi:MAG: phage terminase large subunit, partial [Proteobacteria bacterium]|nr:phage terminase large subunit [Pseudomonadota bacterium]